MHLKNLILDFDGTIGDTRRLIVTTIQDTLRHHGLPVVAPDACAATIGLRLDESFRSLAPLTPAEAQECAATYRRIFERNKLTIGVAPFPHVVETIHRLSSDCHSVAIASSRSHQSLAEYARQFGIEGCLSAIVAADDVVHAKPAPDMALLALRQMGAAAGETLVVGDTEFDIMMGRSAGMRTCGVTYGNASPDKLAQADYLIDDFADLLDIITR